MKNKHVGFLLLGISVLMVFIIFSFTNILNNYVYTSCPYHQKGLECPAIKANNQMSKLSLIMVGIVFMTSLALIVSKPEEKIIIKKIKQNSSKRYDLSELKSEEKTIFSMVKENKAIFQADIIDKTGFGKAKVTRILDKLENKNLIERKRRGMTNIVVLKN